MAKTPSKKANTMRNILLIGIPLLIGGLAVWLSTKKKAVDLGEAKEEDVKEASVAPPAPSPVFPLKQGSKGEKVKELQRLIGADPDGIFGPNTENALIAYAGVRSINTQKEMDDLAKKAIGISNRVRTDDLVNKFNTNTALNMFVIKDSTVRGVEIDAFGAAQNTDKYITLPGGKTYNRTDYVLIGSMKLSGNLLFKITKGTLAGSYVIDPNNVTLK
jgi:hypothetical protein